MIVAVNLSSTKVVIIMSNNYTMKAIEYCERCGIIKFSVKGRYLVYNVSYPEYLGNPRYTMQHKVDLQTGKEEVKQLKRFDKKGLYNR